MEFENRQRSIGTTHNTSEQMSISRLPDELVLHILQYLKFKDVLNLTSFLSKKFNELSKDPKLIPNSFTLNLFRSMNPEKNTRCREQMRDIILRASLLKTLSIEVNNNCNLNEDLIFIASGRCKVSTRMSCKMLDLVLLLKLIPFAIY